MSSPELQGKDGVLIKTVEMHTGGDPLRVVVSGEQNIKLNTERYRNR